jgi:hypothetical protein
MRRVSVPIGYERALLSDVAPFELPPNVSNAGFYSVVKSYNFRWETDISWNGRDAFSDHFAALLASVDNTAGINTHGGRAHIKTGAGWRLPLRFPVRKTNGERRVLSLPHPLSQLQMLSYYEEYSSSLLFACSKSPFSLRKPEARASFTFSDDSTHNALRSRNTSGVESVYREYETFTSYFRYGRYSNINQFYESRQFHRLEARFPYHRRLDVTRCFESLYTHSLDWAIRGHHASKAGTRDEVFSAKLDDVFQAANQGQTNGLLVGPEFSRVGAEIVLQDVDLAVETQLADRDEALTFDKEYWVGRYVDDFFIFCDDEATAKVIQDSIEEQLEKYNLRLNRAKEVNYVGPSRSPIHESKHAMAEHVSLFFSNLKASLREDRQPFSGGDADKLISVYKSLLVDEVVAPTNLNNYVLGVVEKRVKQVARKARPDSREKQELLISALRQVCTLVEFLFFTSPSVSASVRATRTLHTILDFVAGKWLPTDLRVIIFDDVDRACRAVIDRNHVKESAFFSTEASFWLLLHARLGRRYLLEPERLDKYYERSLRSGSRYLTFVTVLLYMDRRRRYNDLRNRIIIELENVLASTHPDAAETIMIKADLIACPFVEKATKEKLMLEWFPTSSPSIRTQAIDSWPTAIFSEWDDFDLGAALRSKEGRRVY